MRVWSVGEVLWDVFPDEERFGGAPLNFCANLRRMGDEARVLSAVGEDERGDLALKKMRQLGLDTGGVARVTGFATGTAVIGRDASGETSFVIPRPAAFDRLAMGAEIFAEAKAANLDWLYFGTLLQTEPAVEMFTTRLAKELGVRCFYDMNLRTGHWNLELVQRLSGLCSVLKLNDVEAAKLAELTGVAGSLEEFCAVWAAQYGIDVICVTLGAEGCLVFDGGAIRVPGYRVTVRDTVGSGDAFAAAFLHGYHRGWAMEETARFANALGALVASRAGATPEWSLAEVKAMMEGTS
jgi:fructokinase